MPCTREAVERIHDVVARLGADLPADALESVSYAFRELAMNAVEWGGKQGFTFDDLPHAAISHPNDPTEHMRARDEKHLRAGGFGLLMVRAQVDELVYNEKQNEVIFIKYLD